MNITISDNVKCWLNHFIMGLSTVVFFLVSFLVLPASGTLFESELNNRRTDEILTNDKRRTRGEEDESLQEVIDALEKRGHVQSSNIGRGIELCWKCTVNPPLGNNQPQGISTQDVLFKAQRSSHVTLTGNAILVFDKISQNIGNAYNPSTGVFVSPCRGRYLFSVTALAPSGKDAHLQVMKNSNVEMGHFYTGNVGGQTASETYVVDLEKGDQVAVKKYPNKSCDVYGNGWTSFLGILLKEA